MTPERVAASFQQETPRARRKVRAAASERVAARTQSRPPAFCTIRQGPGPPQAHLDRSWQVAPRRTWQWRTQLRKEPAGAGELRPKKASHQAAPFSREAAAGAGLRNDALKAGMRNQRGSQS